MDKEIRDALIDKNEDYILLYNGKTIESSGNQKNLIFTTQSDVKVIHLIDCDTDIEYHIGPNADVKVTEVFYRVEKDLHLNIRIYVHRHASFYYISSKTSQNTVHANAITILEEGSYYNNNSLSVLSSDSEFSDIVYLSEPYAKADMKSLIVNTTGNNQNYSTIVYHNQNDTISEFKNYGICSNSSHLGMKTNGIIKKDAKRIELRQKSKGLILDGSSRISTSPILEINDYDCIATHGSSIGAIDEEELYYLMSRGLTRAESERLIISGFLTPILKEIREGKMQDYFRSLINLSI
jgi:Fe-S cluster assembly protein SufD